MDDVRARCASFGPRQRNLVICGETGTGKSVVAQEVHRCSGRSPFVRIAASEIRSGGFEQTLLAGKADDAYSGSRHRSEGLLRSAGGGTVFLDDVQDLPLDVQSYLLDVIEGKPLRPSGELRTFQAHVRWLFGTQQPLDDLVSQGRLKRDLAARMGRTVIRLLPLREHREDIAPLADHLLARIAKVENLAAPALSSHALEVLERQPWPDNVRDLERALWEALVEACAEGSTVIEVRHLAAGIRDAAEPPAGAGRRRVSIEAVLDSLAHSHWVAAEAARELGVSPRTVFRRLKENGLSRAAEAREAATKH